MKKINMLMLLSVLLLSACKKNGNETSQPTVTCKIVSVKEDDETPSLYTYDANGKISTVSYLYGFGKGSFTYETGKVNFIDANGTENQSINVDASGRIISDDFDTYVYNSDGYLIEKYWRSFSTTIPEFVLSYTNGNLTKVTTDKDETIDVTYYENEAYQNLLGYESPLWSSLIFNHHTFSNFTATMTGKNSKNLVRSIVMKRLEYGKILHFTKTYTYKKDQEGKITTLTIVSVSPDNYFNGTRVINFTYECI